MRTSALAVCLALAGALAFPCSVPAQKEDSAKQMARDVRAILAKHCQACHGEKAEVEGFDVRDHKSLLARREDGEPYIIPKQPAKSQLLRRFGTSMPPKKVKERPTAGEKALLKKWIEAGAPEFPRDETSRKVKAPPREKVAIKKLAVQARTVLKQYCQRCHGIEFQVESLDVLNVKGLTTKRDDKKSPYYVKPGSLEDSSLYKRFGKSMPPGNIRERPSAEDKALIKRWIEAGAPDFPKDEARPFLGTKDTLTAMRDHLLKTDEVDRPYLRYFTLTHLHNDPKVPENDLRDYRGALSKAINSLSWKKDVVVPEAVDKHETVFAVDIRDLDWDRDHLWRAIMSHYPYALDFDSSPDRDLRQIDQEVHALTKCEIPSVRVDWFVATATRPPLYHTLLRLPMHAGELERKLEVDFEANFRRNRLARGGFATSGVSGQNRLVERHSALHGAYWKSYDFKEKGGRGNLIQLPLGPVFKNNPYPRLAFQHDGGEMIFNLPNGLQGYFLVDGKDRRIDAGPEEVVNDALKTSGTPAIVNGLSCMACHKHGMIAFKDEIRDGTAVVGRRRDTVERLYPEDKVMKKWLKQDSDRFLQALEKAMGPFVQVGENKAKPITAFAEPVGDLARRYRLVDLKLAAAAYELGYQKPEDLEAAIKANRRLRDLGLGALLRGGAIKRHEWEKVGARSLFQRVANELERGTPRNVKR